MSVICYIYLHKIWQFIPNLSSGRWICLTITHIVEQKYFPENWTLPTRVISHLGKQGIFSGTLLLLCLPSPESSKVFTRLHGIIIQFPAKQYRYDFYMAGPDYCDWTSWFSHNFRLWSDILNTYFTIPHLDFNLRTWKTTLREYHTALSKINVVSPQSRVNLMLKKEIARFNHEL
jgi:hypothetical protein